MQTADVQLVNLADAHSTCTTYPCATSSLATGTHNDSATIGVSMYASTAVTPHPSTYYTNFIGVKNSGSASHIINSITISNIVDASSSLGNITIFMCASSVDVSVSANAATCAHYSITSTTGGSIASGSTVTMPYTLAASSTVCHGSASLCSSLGDVISHCDVPSCHELGLNRNNYQQYD